MFKKVAFCGLFFCFFISGFVFAFTSPKQAGGCFEAPCFWEVYGDEVRLADGQYGIEYTDDGKFALIQRVGQKIIVLEKSGVRFENMSTETYNEYRAFPGYEFYKAGERLWIYRSKVLSEWKPSKPIWTKEDQAQADKKKSWKPSIPLMLD